MEKWINALVAGGQFTSFGGVGIAIAAVLLLLLRVLLPADERRRIRVPLYLLVGYLVVVSARALVPSPAVDEVLAVFGFFLLLACIGQLGFLLLIDWLLGRRLARPLPKIFRDIIQALVYFGVAFLTLPLVGLEPGQLLTTSALLTAVIGLSLQETLGNLFAGLAIQAQRPFEIGDWVELDLEDDLVGYVTEINWRATKVMTDDLVEVIVPNGTLAKVPIFNFTQPTPISRRLVKVQGPYEAPPHVVTQALLQAIEGCPEVRTSPKPDVLVRSYDDSGIEYALRYFISDYSRRQFIDSHVRTRIWYAFQRAGISVPFPIRDVRNRDTAVERDRASATSLQTRLASLASVEILSDLSPEALGHLARGTRSVLYSDGEAVIRQGQPGSELFIVHRGEVVVLLGPDPLKATEVARLGPNQFFGEMSLLTGEKRTATVVASGACELFVVGHEELADLLEKDPQLAEHFAEVLAGRQAQLDERASGPSSKKTGGQAQSSVLLSRIKSFFSL